MIFDESRGLPFANDAELLEKFSRRKIPFVAFIELTSRCNLNCLHCARDKKKPSDLPAGLFKSLVKQLAEMGTPNIVLTGGEPVLHRNFLDFADFVRENEFNLKIDSNGSRFNRSEIDLLRKLNHVTLQISIYGATPAIHDAVTRTKGSHRTTLRAIRGLRDAGVSICVHMIVMRDNYSDLEKVKAIANKERWRFSYDFTVYPRDDESPKPLRYRITDNQLKEATTKKLLRRRDFEEPVSAKYDRMKILDLASVSCRVSSSGQVFPSGTLRLEMGNLKSMSFTDIWRRSPAMRRLRNLKASQFECALCRFSARCSWDIGLAYADHRQITATPKEWCRLVNGRNVL